MAHINPNAAIFVLLLEPCNLFYNFFKLKTVMPETRCESFNKDALKTAKKITRKIIN